MPKQFIHINLPWAKLFGTRRSVNRDVERVGIPGEAQKCHVMTFVINSVGSLSQVLNSFHHQQWLNFLVTRDRRNMGAHWSQPIWLNANTFPFAAIRNWNVIINDGVGSTQSKAPSWTFWTPLPSADWYRSGAFRAFSHPSLQSNLKHKTRKICFLSKSFPHRKW